MKGFLELFESLSIRNIFGSSVDLISSYLSRQSGKKFFPVLVPERFKNSRASGRGVRFFSKDGNIAVRFNWKTGDPASASLDSIDLFENSTSPRLSIAFGSDVSLVKILPVVADMIKNSKNWSRYRGKDITAIFEESDSGDINLDVVGIKTRVGDIALDTSAAHNFRFRRKKDEEEFVTELAKRFPEERFTVEDSKYVKTSEGYLKSNPFLTEDALINLTESIQDISDVFDGSLEILQDPNFSGRMLKLKYGPAGKKLFNTLRIHHPDFFSTEGRAITFVGGEQGISAIRRNKENILKSIGAVKIKVAAGGSSEVVSFDTDKEVEQIENDRERLTFEKQLEDLDRLLKLTVSGASNACFVAGKGGVGKTFTTEKVLAEVGLRDGSGYFKNTGSISAAGLYALLFRYKNNIVLFDDSDDVFKDQASRNILKAATDTKKNRKLVWNKMGPNVVDEDEYASPEELLDDGKVPRSFEFSGKIIFISNLPLNKLDPDGAIRTRAFIIEIDPTETEIYDFMEKIVVDMPLDAGLELGADERKNVVTLLRGSKSKQSANLRKLSRGLNIAASAKVGGISISNAEMARMISTYA